MTTNHPSGREDRAPTLTRLMWISIAAALATIALKTLAWRLTGSVGLLSDAAESTVNLFAAVAGLLLPRWASSPPNRHHPYGHEKAEYFSAGLEGGLFVVAAAMIAFSAAQRLLHRQPLHAVGPGLAASAVAALLNLAVGLVMVREGRRLRSIVVEADGRPLLTDVWTSIGVIAGVGGVALTGWLWLDPAIALAVDVNIVVTGVALLRRAGDGLMEAALPARSSTRSSGRSRRIATRPSASTRSAPEGGSSGVHLAARRGTRRWTVTEGHSLLDRFECDVRAAVPDAVVETPLEPADERAPTESRDLRDGRSPGPLRG